MSEESEGHEEVQGQREDIRHFMEIAADGIFVVDDSGRFRWVNASLVEMLGYPRERLLEMALQDLIPEEELATSPLRWPEVRAGRTVRIQRRFRRADGEVIDVELSGNQVAPDRYQTIVRDVTDRRRSEEARSRLAAIVEASDDAIIGKTPDGVITDWNAGAERLYGYTAEDVVGRPVAILVPEGLLEEENRILAEVARGRSVRSLETTRLRKGGERIQVVLSLSPIRGEDGSVTGIASVARDVTERKRMERVLRESEARFRSLIEHATDIITIVDRDGTNFYQSPAAATVTGYDVDALVGRDAFELIHPDDREYARQVWSDVLASPGAVKRARVRFLHADGGWRTFETVNQNLLDDPAVGGVVVNTRDVTQEVELEKQLRQALKMEAVGRLAGGIAHDFNNLLTVIRAQTELLLMDRDEEGLPAEELRIVRDAAQHGASLTSQLLAFSRDQVLRSRVVDLNAAIRGMEGLLARLLGEDLRLRTELAPDLPPVELDPVQLEQVVMNLAVNARDAMPEGGDLSLATELEEITEEQAATMADVEPGPRVCLRVSDTGSGMDEATLGRIFEPFFTTKRDYGTGLGLAVSYGIVKQSGGTIDVESEPGRGTTFLIRFPPSQGRPENNQRKAIDDLDAVALTGTVLVVDDDSSVRRVTCRILERAGMEVLAADSGEEGLRILAEAGDTVDLLVTDLVLPRMSGRQLTDHVRERHPGLPMIAMSGYAEGSPGNRSDLPEDVGFVQKPFSLETLLTETRRALVRKRR